MRANTTDWRLCWWCLDYLRAQCSERAHEAKKELKQLCLGRSEEAFCRRGTFLLKGTCSVSICTFFFFFSVFSLFPISRFLEPLEHETRSWCILSWPLILVASVHKCPTEELCSCCWSPWSSRTPFSREQDDREDSAGGVGHGDTGACLYPFFHMQGPHFFALK